MGVAGTPEKLCTPLSQRRGREPGRTQWARSEEAAPGSGGRGLLLPRPPGRGPGASVCPARACGSQGVELAPSSRGLFLQGRDGVRAGDSGDKEVTVLMEALLGHAEQLREGCCVRDEPPLQPSRAAQQVRVRHPPSGPFEGPGHKYGGAEGTGAISSWPGRTPPRCLRCAGSGPHGGRGCFPPTQSCPHPPSWEGSHSCLPGGAEAHLPGAHWTALTSPEP